MNGNIEETKISNGILEFEKFKQMATEAIERCKKAEEESAFYRGQNDMLQKQHEADNTRHRADLTRIAELETFISSILEQYRSAEEKLRLGHFRRPNSNGVRPAGNPAVESSVSAALEDELRKLRPVVAQEG